MIYLDHAATTSLKPDVLQAMLPYFSDQFANASSSYQAARAAQRAIDLAKGQIAALIGASAQEIYMTSGGSESDNWALFGVMRSAAPEKRQLIVSSIEHHAVLRACEALEREGYLVTYAPVDGDGVVDIEAIRRAITPQTALISVMLANNETGVIQPIREIARMAHAYGALMHTDAVQAVGHIPVDVQELDVDLLSMSAHKFYGPKGVGALYIRKGTHIGRLIYGGEQEKGMRAGTENTAGIVGMGKAALLAMQSMEKSAARIQALRNEMIDLIRSCIPGAAINGLGAARLPGHVHVTIDHAHSALLLMQLDMAGVAASSGSACASGAAERSHVMAAMGHTGDDQADLRFTLGERNTREEITRTVDLLAGILNQ